MIMRDLLDVLMVIAKIIFVMWIAVIVFMIVMIVGVFLPYHLIIGLINYLF